MNYWKATTRRRAERQALYLLALRVLAKDTRDSAEVV